MTKQKYSPITQAVSDAVNNAYWDWGNLCPADAHTIAAAALRAAVEQTAQAPVVIGEPLRGDAAKAMTVIHASDLLDIANELEGRT